MDGAMILPVVVHLFEIKRLILYSPIHQAPGGYRYRTTVMSYVERGKVTQVATDGIAPPSSDDDVFALFSMERIILNGSSPVSQASSYHSNLLVLL